MKLILKESAMPLSIVVMSFIFIYLFIYLFTYLFIYVFIYVRSFLFHFHIVQTPCQFLIDKLARAIRVLLKSIRVIAQAYSDFCSGTRCS